MSNIVFLLGAGASAQCGAPVMSNFLDVAAGLLRTNQVREKREQFERVFEVIGGLQAVHSKAQLDLNNIEAVFTALELGRIIQRVPGMKPEEIPQAISSLKELIVQTLELTIKFPTHGTTINPPRAYEAFAKVIEYLQGEAMPQRSCSVITFNYDVAVDMALHRVHLGPEYFLHAGRGKGVPLLKLHGSLNWAIENDPPHAIHPLHLRDYFSRYSIHWSRDEIGTTVLPFGTQLKEYFDTKTDFSVAPEPVIVPPSWNKADYHHALSNVWAAAASQLAEAEYLFVIGYSLPETDAFFRHLYALGSVGPAPLRKVIVFNPEEEGGGVDTRFRALLGPGAMARYEYRSLTFDKTVDEIRKFFPKTK
jgi:hypothetical protein